MSQPRILLIYTGGTIGMVKDYESGALKAFDFDEILEHIPEINQLSCKLSHKAFKTPIDSSDMQLSHWVALADIIEQHYESHDGFVVLHGSDTMSYTASALSFMLENLRKPVIFTGSQLPIGDLRTDAKENLITSIELASMKKRNAPLIQEVCLYFEYKLYRGNRTTKINAEHFEAFSSPNYPPLATTGVHLNVLEEYLWKSDSKKPLQVHKKLDDRVGLLKLFPGISEGFVRAILNTGDLKGLVIETYGAGNAPTVAWLLNLLEEAIESGIHVVNVTQCIGGSVLMGHYATSKDLLRMKVIDGKDMTTETALSKLMYLLGRGISGNTFKTIFETSLRGEMG